MQSSIQTDWTSPWWTFHFESAGPWGYLYSGFNLAEGVIWSLFAIIVWGRFLKHRNSNLEIVYGFVFLMFGATDFVEATAISLPLLIVKGVVLVVLLTVRRFIQKSYYPTAWF